MQGTPVNVDRPICRLKVLELILGYLAAGQGKLDRDIHLRELGLLYVQDASATMLVLPPESQVPCKPVFVPCLTAVEDAVVCRIVFAAGGTSRVGHEAPFCQCASAGVLVFHVSEQLLFGIPSE
jgi:hypothetical protein